MKKYGKKYQEKKKMLDKEIFPLQEAVDLSVDTSPSSFDATVEVHANMNLDPRHADQNLRATVSLPHGTGKKIRIAVFAEEADAKKALEAGADKAGEDQLIDEVTKGNIDFDVAIATPTMMKKMGKIAKVLGPKGMMPNPKAGTVTPDVSKAVEDLKKGKIEYRCDKEGIVHVGIGKISFGKEKIMDNVKGFLSSLLENKPKGAKGAYFKSLTLSSSMGPGIAVDISSAMEIVKPGK